MLFTFLYIVLQMQELEHKVHDSTERAEKAEKQVRFCDNFFRQAGRNGYT